MGLCWCAGAEDIHGISKEQAKSNVQKFYSAIQRLPKIGVNDFYDLRNNGIYPYIVDNQALNHPNDIQPFIANSHNMSRWTQINTYIGNIREYCMEHTLSIEFSICDIRDLREVVYENKKERLALTYWELTVDKKININGRTYSFMDTVDVKINNGKIAFISNRIYRQASPRPDGNRGEHIEAWHNELLARAARYWSQGRKREAYDAYVKSVENYDDSDTFFRIGVLLLKHHKECTDLSKNRARDMAYSYFLKAQKLGHTEARRVIDWHWGNYGGHTI